MIMIRAFVKIALLVCFSVVLFFSCEKKTHWDLNPSGDRILIVDGIITNELKQQVIQLSLSFNAPNDTAGYPENAVVSVSDGTDTFLFIEDGLNPGRYVSETAFAGVVNKTYSLEVNYADKTYTAEAEMYPVGTSISLSYQPNSDSTMYYIPSEVAQFNPNEAAMYEVFLDWSDVTGYEDLPESQTTALLYYYVLTTIDVNQIFAPEQETVLFPAGTSLQLKKYSLSPEYETFIRSILLETQWHGSNFDSEEGNVNTNISSGALGFFGACSVIFYSTVVE
jgi:hypothetical protein